MEGSVLTRLAPSPGGRPRRVLVVAYEFPPVAAGGVARTLKFVRYLPHFGWQPYVLTVRNPPGAARDTTLLPELPAGVRVWRTTSWEHHRVRDLFVRAASGLGLDPTDWREGLAWRLRGLWDRFAMPDHKVFWAAPAILAGVWLVVRHRLDAIYSTSWPYADHVAALAISRLTGRPLVADFRDPWTQHMNYRPPSRGWDRMQRRLERAVCAAAKFVVTPTQSATAGLRRMMPDLPRGRFVTVRNGFDPTDFAGQVPPAPRFDIVHAGTFYRSRRPDTFLAGLGEFLRQVPEAATHTRVRLFGLTDHDFGSGLHEHPCVEARGWVPHREAVGAFRQAAVLLLVLHGEKGTELTIPGKVYEYMATGNHVLACPVDHRELRRLLAAYRNATILGDYEPGAIAGALTRLYRRWRAGALPACVPGHVQRLSRVERTRELASLLNRAIGEKPLKKGTGSAPAGPRDGETGPPHGACPVFQPKPHREHVPVMAAAP